MLKDFLRKVQFPIMLACGAAPICAVRFAMLAPEFLYLAWLLPAAMVLLSVPCLLLPDKRLFTGLFLGLLYMVAGIWLVCLANPNKHLIAVPILYGLLLLYTVPMGSWPWYQEPPSMLFILGIVLHIAAQVGMSFLSFWEFYALEPIRIGLTVCFIILALMTLLSRSRTSLASAARENPVIPKATRQKNLLLVLAFFLVVTVLSCFSLLADGIMAIFRGIIAFISLLTNLGNGHEETTATSIETTQPTPLETFPTPPTSETAKALEALLLAVYRYLLPVIVFALLVVAAILLCKYSSVIFRKLNLLLRHYAASAAADYEEEITDTRDCPDPEDIPEDKPVRLSILQRRRLSPTEKIRRRYRQLQKRNPKWLASSTARENLPADASPLYEQARYSNNPIPPEDAVEFVSKTKRL